MSTASNKDQTGHLAYSATPKALNSKADNRSDAERVNARIKELESDPYTNTAPGSELHRLYQYRPYANTYKRTGRSE